MGVLVIPENLGWDRFNTWWVWSVLISACMFLGCVSVFQANENGRQLDMFRSQSALLLEKRIVESGTSSPAPTDFTLDLPAIAPVNKIVQQVFKLAARNSLVVLSAEPQAPVRIGTAALSATPLIFKLTGQYPQIKAWLAQVLEGNPGLTVRQLSIRSRSDSAKATFAASSVATSAEAFTQEAVITLVQWTMPKAASASASVPGS